MADYSLNINGTEYTEVQGTEDWSKSIVRDFNDRVFRTKGNFQFTGWGELFDLIYGNVFINGACESLNGRVYFRESKVQEYAEWWRGEIKMQDGKWDLLRQKVDTQILDDIWKSKIDNSSNQKVFLRSDRSKNGTFIGVCDYNLCQFYDPTDSAAANYLADRRLCFRIKDVFEFLVAYHTDGKATFQSTFFGNGGDGEQYYITTGQEIREAAGWVNPEVSFSEVFTEMNKKCNLWIILDVDDFDNPIVRIEQQSYVFANTKAVEIEDPEAISMQIDLDQLYTTIDVGSTAVDFDIDNDANYPNPRFNAWNDESYNTPGGCEFENNSLDLVSSWKIDTNTIEKVINANDDTYDKDIFLVEIDPTAPDYDAYKFTTALTGDGGIEYIYNFNLTNEQVIANWFDGIPTPIVKYLTQEYYCAVDSPTPYTSGVGSGIGDEYTAVIEFENEIDDKDDIYTTTAQQAGDDTVGEFKAPVDGIFNFDVDVWVSKSLNADRFVTITAHVFTDNTGARRRAIINNAPDGRGFMTSTTTKISGNFNIYLLFGEVVVFRMYDSARAIGQGGLNLIDANATLNRQIPSYAETNTAPLIYTYDISRFKLSLTDFNTLDNNLGYIRFIDSKQNKKYDVWATDLQYNPISQMVEVGKFIGKPPITECVWILVGGEWQDDNCWEDSQLWID